MRTSEGTGLRLGSLFGSRGELSLGLSFLVACLIATLALFFLGPGAVVVWRNFEGIAPGVVADRDVKAGQDAVYVDKEATRLRIEAEERLVLPIFNLDSGVTDKAKARYKDFEASFRGLEDQNIAQATAILMLQSKFPGMLSEELLSSLAASPLKSQVLVYAEDILSSLLDAGIFSLPSEGLSLFNPDYFELRRILEGKQSVDQRPFSTMVTRVGLEDAIGAELRAKHLARPLSTIVQGLVSAFATENSFFDEAGSTTRLRKVASKVEPVTKSVGRDEVLIRKGEMVTEETYARLTSIRAAMSKTDLGYFLRGFGLLAAAVGLAYLLLRSGRKEMDGDSGALIALGIYASLGFYVVVLLAARAGGGDLDGAYFVPASLFSGVAAILAGQGLALTYTIVLGLLTASASNLDSFFLVFVLLSGILASFSVTTAKTRIDLVRAGFIQAAAQFLMGLVLLAHFDLGFAQVLAQAGYLALNGFVGSVLLLVVLPILEQSLNLATRFRLLELSDVNAPALKNLLTQAPGTYAHSMNVAHLAEAAAEEIGANALLARVGAYYHDLGKSEQPEYFIENQKGVNKHDEINPRLSATVIRSHVKLGIEKAKELRLPKPVVDIVGQHHGSSLIAWFYDKAKSQDESIRKEDFTYPGSPPIGKEAGIVMLADAVEASTRTLKSPSVPRIDAHVGQLILTKVEEGQLDRCALTMSDLQSVRRAFVRILAGQYHSRIEYPNQKEDA